MSRLRSSVNIVQLHIKVFIDQDKWNENESNN